MWGDRDRRDGGALSAQVCLGLGEVRTHFWRGPEPRLEASGQARSQPGAPTPLGAGGEGGPRWWDPAVLEAGRTLGEVKSWGLGVTPLCIIQLCFVYHGVSTVSVAVRTSSPCSGLLCPHLWDTKSTDSP